MKEEIWKLIEGNTPLIAAAIHDGNFVREELKNNMVLKDDDQFREEDPFTGKLTEIADTRLIGLRSRFEVDLNRPRNSAVYINPEDAWGLKIYGTPPSQKMINHSFELYDKFYSELDRLLNDFKKRFGRFVVYDIHSYCYRRKGPDEIEDDPKLNPEVNIGTGTMNRKLWAPIIDRFISDLKSFNYMGSHLDVRENIKFKGGYFPKYIHEKFPESACVISIEFKKFFMDEWTGNLYEDKFEYLKSALNFTAQGVMSELGKINKSAKQ